MHLERKLVLVSIFFFLRLNIYVYVYHGSNVATANSEHHQLAQPSIDSRFALKRQQQIFFNFFFACFLQFCMLFCLVWFCYGRIVS